MRPASLLAALKVLVEVVVDVTRPTTLKLRKWLLPIMPVLILGSAAPRLATAAVLPEDRMDLLYHVFDGDGANIQGPSVLVRKAVNEKVSLHANYYVDMVSSASIDVRATASPYEEQRTETTVGVDYLADNTTWSLSATGSDESDYTARSLGFGISQTLFGDLTTISLSASAGEDEVSRNNDTSFSDTLSRRRFGINISQILTKNLIVGLSAEAVVDQGYLNNPYRSVRYADPTSARGYSYEPEVYPRTRNSDALAVRAMYYLPWRASLRSEFRFFSDSWGITANNAEVTLIQPVDSLAKGLTLELKLRTYAQSEADFYSDLYPFRQAQTFLARDKELSQFTTRSLGFGISYEFKPPLAMLDKSSINLYWDYMQFRYDNFNDVLAGGPAGDEPAFGFDANVVRLFFSVWY
ncbi:MAG: hypothetical protein ACJATP_003660 [Candidatus Azotimanducaceae bacterium]|jgi:hypothetical protein